MFEVFLITYLAVTAILLAVCGYNDLTGTPAPIVFVGWPLVLIGFAIYGIFMIPVVAGRALRKIVP